MKKIDLTVRMNKVSMANMPEFSTTNITTTNPLLERLGMVNTLQRYIINALNNYIDCTIAQSADVIALAQKLKETPTCEVSEENFTIIESAIANAPAYVKAAWLNMVQSLNTEG